MSKIPVFRGPKDEAEYIVAYDAVLKQWPVPCDELYVPTSLGNTHVIASGPGDATPLLLLHPSGANATIWYRNVGPLSQEYRTYAIDTIGEPNKSILTCPIKRNRQRQQFAKWITDLLDGLQIGDTHIIGNSFGGFLALNTVLCAPERIKKAVLISPAASFANMWAWYWHFVPAGVGSLIGWKRIMLKPYAWIWQGFPQDKYIFRLREITAIAGRQRHWFPSVFSDEELRKIRTPILLLIGDREVIYDPKQVIRKATRSVAGLKAEIIPNANHNAEYTAAEAVNDRIRSFLLDP
jgi:pimeloyl-ACP methyl ester carboxylesterase